MVEYDKEFSKLLPNYLIDTYISYWIFINRFADGEVDGDDESKLQVIVSRHKDIKTWDCTILGWDEEITINCNTTPEFIINLLKLMKHGK